ncbi:farnesyl pyrophosphate synthase [Ramicandelaber brevisporus]|nr:farnesyl pyrophosphate synthase [Ramicandelaber brevisporus]
MITRLREVLEYNVPHGKMNRGLSVIDAFRVLSGKSELDEKEYFRAATLGWCIELLQAMFLVSDDIMDSSLTRRGQPCWYRVPAVGMIAINDSFLIKSALYRLIKKYFRQDAFYADLLDLFQDVTYETELGQMLDLITAPEDDVDLTRFNMHKYSWIVIYKTAFYSFYLPVACAMILSGITDETAYAEAKKILLPLGEYFQVQDDYLDCYGDPSVIGKIGTDIEVNKCSWLVNTALNIATPEQRAILEENYGQKEPEKVAKVKALYKELDIPKLFAEFEEKSYQDISKMIADLDEKVLKRQIFIDFMAKIYKRSQ